MVTKNTVKEKQNDSIIQDSGNLLFIKDGISPKHTSPEKNVSISIGRGSLPAIRKDEGKTNETILNKLKNIN